MAATNFTGDEKQKKLQQIYCSADFAEEIHNQLRSLSVINIFLSITAFLGNTLILVALRKESSLNLPSKLLLRSLAATDLCVGLGLAVFTSTVLLFLATQLSAKPDTKRFVLYTFEFKLTTTSTRPLFRGIAKLKQ
jgi:hypothetical protein